MDNSSKGESQMTAAERGELFDALRGIQTGTMERGKIKEIQSRLKDKYPNTYGSVRRELGNQLAKGNNSKGKAVTKKDIPVIAISIGMGKMKEHKGKAKMMRGGMSGGKEHMYAAGGMVKDNPGLKALKAASPEAYNKITGK